MRFKIVIPFIFLISLLIASLSAFSQNKFIISGTIKDKKTGEELIGAALRVKEIPGTGVVTNSYGFFSLTLPQGNYTLISQFIGYEAKEIPIKLTENIRLTVEIGEKLSALQEVEIKGEKENSNITSSEVSSQKVNIKAIESIPVMFGEKDILKTIQLLPGVKSQGEGNSGFYVRGGGADQNLILLDEANVYNASHLLGFFSVFNSDAIKDVNVIKGGMPAEYGGRLSSVLDIKMNEGSSKKFGATGGIGLISSRLTIDGPIIKNKGSFIISGRRTYADLFLKLSNNKRIKDAQLYFYDLNLKANYNIGKNDRIFLSGYFGKDVFGYAKTIGMQWGNTTGTLRWNHLFNEKLFLNTSLIYSDYGYTITAGTTNMTIAIKGAIKDWNLKQDLQYFINSKNTLKVGFNSIYHTFSPGEISSTIGSVSSKFSLDKKYALDNAIYISDEIDITGQLKLVGGLRFSMFSNMGPTTVYYYDAKANITDSSVYKSGVLYNTYKGLEPRLALNYIFNETTSLKVSYSRNNQYLQLLSNSTTSLPTDIWIPCSPLIKPQVSDQVSLGAFKNFHKNMFESSIEIYYKNMANMTDYKNGANIMFNKYVESQLLFGRGWSYGAEFFIKKKYGKFNGWIGYTWSKTERQVIGINNDNAFPAKQDRTHDVSVVGIYELSKKFTISATWVFNTGNAVTFPSGKYLVNDQVVSLYTERNGYRMPPYHRGDLSITYFHKKTEKYESNFNLSIYNVYNRENAYIIEFRQSASDPNKTEAVQISLFRILPSLTWNFKF